MLTYDYQKNHISYNIWLAYNNVWLAIYVQKVVLCFQQ